MKCRAKQRQRHLSQFVLLSLASILFAAAIPALNSYRVSAEQAPTSPTVACPNPADQVFENPPELGSTGGILRGTIVLIDERQRLPESRGGNITCHEVRVRNFRGVNPEDNSLLGMRPTKSAHPKLSDPQPGPTLRARVGDLVQLTFVNEVNPNNFDPSLDIEKCTEVGKGGQRYPEAFKDKYPNCLHASSTANIHFHGTHTNPNSTGDNVYLQIRPLPRDNQGNLTTTRAEATVGFAEFFERCAAELLNPLQSWPVTWDHLPRVWTDKQKELLIAYQTANPDQRLWDENQKALKDGWPIYYIGAFPYCFVLPAYSDAGRARPVMGQIPGTHWYHAHKHGSTAINVANGMTGAFIIEGQYDDDLNDRNTGYGSFILERDGKREPWNTRSQPILVLNQLASDLNPTSGGGANWDNLDFVVNGRIRPTLRMQPGEVQLWRIVNTSSRSASYFMPPVGLEWMQLAQDGVQLADENYQVSRNKPFYLAPANRVDLLVKAPLSMKGKSADVRIQNVMARRQVRPNLEAPDPVEGAVLLVVNIDGPAVEHEGQPAEMPFLAKRPDLPSYLQDITADELRQSNYTTRKFVFDSKDPQTTKVQHTINQIHFGEGSANVKVLLNAVEEWTIENRTLVFGSAGIDHPFHIHINPFQVTEVFDPNETFFSEKANMLLARYVPLGGGIQDSEGQCVLDPRNPATLKECKPKRDKFIWHDVYAMPSARNVTIKFKENDQEVEASFLVPGYFKMRSRFVDYPGLYVMHCHILIHEDRGMMFSVEVVDAKPTPVRHH